MEYIRVALRPHTEQVLALVNYEKAISKNKKYRVADLIHLNKPAKKTSQKYSIHSGSKHKLQTKWNKHQDDEDKLELADQARKQSRIYLIIGILLLIISFVGIGDLIVLTFPSAIFFLIASLLKHRRRKKYLNPSYSLPEKDSPKSAAAKKANFARKANFFFLILSLIFFIGGFFALPLLAIVPVFLTIAWIFSSRRRKFEIQNHKNENPDASQKLIEEQDLNDSKKASYFGWRSILFLFLGITGLFFSLVAFIGFAFSSSWVFLLIMLAGLFASFLFMRTASEKGNLAKEHGKKVLDRHPNEKYYSARRKALFGKRVGSFSKRTWLISLIFILLLILIILATI